MAEDVRKWKQSSTPHHGGRQLCLVMAAGLMGLILSPFSWVSLFPRFFFLLM